MLRDAEPHLKEIVNALKMVQDTKNSKDAISVLARLSALANQQVAIVNNEMANLYSENSDD